MQKSLFTPDYAILLKLLRDTRRASGISQEQLATHLGVGQSIVSKWERGEARLDIIQLRTICLAMGTDLKTFIRRFEKQIDATHE
jgi:transcriptional regulator with XRE-family HTH domain